MRRPILLITGAGANSSAIYRAALSRHKVPFVERKVCLQFLLADHPIAHERILAAILEQIEAIVADKTVVSQVGCFACMTYQARANEILQRYLIATVDPLPALVAQTTRSYAKGSYYVAATPSIEKLFEQRRRLTVGRRADLDQAIHEYAKGGHESTVLRDLGFPVTGACTDVPPNQCILHVADVHAKLLAAAERRAHSDSKT